MPYAAARRSGVTLARTLLAAMLLAGSRAIAQAPEVTVITRMYEVNAHLALSADGEFLAYCSGDYSARTWKSSLDVHRLSTGEATRLPSSEYQFNLVISPDSKQLYVASGSYNGDMILDRMPLLGGSATRVAEGKAKSRLGSVGLSPDGKSIAFFRTTSIGETRLMISAADGSGQRQLQTWPGSAPTLVPTAARVPLWKASAASIDGLAWSPDGSEIAVGWWEGAKSKLIAVSIRTGATRDLVLLDDGSGPAFAWPVRDGGLYMPRHTDNLWRIWRYDISNREWRVIPIDGTIYRSHLSMSADGRVLAAMRFLAQPTEEPSIGQKVLSTLQQLWAQQPPGNMEMIVVHLKR